MRPVTLLTARMSKDGKRVLCGNRQCRHSGLAEVQTIAPYKSAFNNGHFKGKPHKRLLLAKGLDRRPNGTYAHTKRPFERTRTGFEAREALRTEGVDITGNSTVMSLADLGLVKRSEEYQEQPQVVISDYALENKAIRVSCPRCRNCSEITKQVVEGGMPVKK